MTIGHHKPAVTTLALAISVALGIVATPAQAYESPVHVFSVDDVLGDFDGTTYGNTGATEDRSIICGEPSSDVQKCPDDAAQPIVDKKTGQELYPIDSEYGFYVVDFVGALEKVRDGDYGEGWIGNLIDGSGVAISNAITDRYKVKAPLGTWCQGLGGNSVKCSTEHYTTMEHVLSCHEVIPYFYSDEVPEGSGIWFQGTQQTPDVPPSLYVDCAEQGLDDELFVLVDGAATERLIDSTPCLSKDPNDPSGCQMFANDNTTVLDDIAVGSDYSVTLKDDGKALYRWGALIKRPNDVRLYARLELPAEWKERDPVTNELPNYTVTKAWLVVNHTITNNPNDQLRPEDLENEAAIGVLPDHTIEEDGKGFEVWKSTKVCYEGDGDLIDNEEGTSDPTAIGVGTVFKNMQFAVDGSDADEPLPFSGDLVNALTNAWYTTIDREPFEWSYVLETDDGDKTIVDYTGCSGPQDSDYAADCNIPADATLYSGPRWRLKPNKFGQDLPGLEIPTTAALNEPCTPPPFTKELIKYEVGAPTTTVINLLDWNEEENGLSPLATSRGWVDSRAYNEFISVGEDDVVDDNGEPRQITSIGAPMSEDFDLTVYIKGDRKPVSLYNAQLILEYEGEPPPTEPAEVDMAMDAIDVPRFVSSQDPALRVFTVSAEACNLLSNTDTAAGTITLVGDALDAGVPDVSYVQPFNAVAPGDCALGSWSWTAPDTGTSVRWTATVSVSGDLTDPVPENDTLKKRTTVYPLY